MEIVYLLNKSVSNECVKKSTDEAITIEAGGTYTSAKITADDFSFIRFYINFNTSNIEPNCNNIKVYIMFKPKGVPTTATAVGMFVEVPIKTGKVNTGNTPDAVCFSDGDIPIYDNDIYIVIKNNKTVPHVLRNITIMKIR